jgi:hypothetical protein
MAGLIAGTIVAAGHPVSGILNLHIQGSGGDLKVDLSAPALTLVGFAGRPTTTTQRADLRLATENLRNGNALVRFNPEAQCTLTAARIDADPAGDIDTADLGAHYRFACTIPGALKSAALGLFIGFPALGRVHVRYQTTQGQGEAVLTRGSPVVNFVPMY